MPLTPAKHPSEPNLDHLAQLARRVRIATVNSIYESGGGHYGGSLSVIDILVALFHHTHNNLERDGALDKIVLSKGHAAPGYYAVMSEYGLIEPELLQTYGKVGSVLQGHPDMSVCPQVAFSTGSLGQGFSAALGMALVLRDIDAHAWAVLGDGECQEGMVWEAAMVADRLRLGNLTAIVDQNGLQEWGYRSNAGAEPPITNARKKWEAFGWKVLETDGHDHRSLLMAMQEIEVSDAGPTVILASTTKGFGSELVVSQPDRFHCDQLSELEYETVLSQI